jgi:Cytochrome c554 and c-prime
VELMTSWKRTKARTWVLGGAAFLIVAVVAIVVWRNAGVHLSGKLVNGPPAHSIAGVASADEPGAARSQARSAVAAGRFDQAFELYRGLDRGRWAAEDCLGLGSALLQRDRIVLGWSALEAARRIDPKSSDTLRALEGIEGKLASARGDDSKKLLQSEARVQVLRAITGGPPLGLLVVGLAAFSSDSVQEEEFLDRLGVRDRVVLRGVDSISGAASLVARLLLETGRPTEAYALLNSMVSSALARAQDVPDAPTPDREIAWLLSRAALQLDQHATADAMLAMAGDFGKRITYSPEPAPFVGATRCGECHGKIYHEQQGESPHALTLRLGSNLKDVPLPAQPVPDPVVTGITHAFARKGDDCIELASRAGDQVFEAIVNYAVGSGRHGITMIARDKDGIDRELRVSYFAEKQSWGETKGIDFAPRDAGDHIGIPMLPLGLHHCLHCHATWFRSVDFGRTGARGPEGQDRGIGCERCHGPGLNHVKAARSGYAEMAIALTAKTPHAVRLKSCAGCHAADGSIQPGDPEFTRAQGTTFPFSRCYKASKDQMSCTTCHDPHRSVETRASLYETKCLTCHGAISTPIGTAASSRVDHETKRTIAPACPVNATANCISCHMPKVDDPSRRSRFTDHHIRIHRSSGAVSTTKAQP